MHIQISFICRWFSYTKYESFQRQLNIYGFKRIKVGVDKNCYYHKNFLRGEYILAQRINRVPIKKLTVPIHSSINHLAPISALPTLSNHPAVAMATPSITNTRIHHMPTNDFNRGIIPLSNATSGEIRDQLSTASRNVTGQSNLLLSGSIETSQRSGDHYIDADAIINRYIRNTLLNRIPAPELNSEALQILLRQLQSRRHLSSAPMFNNTSASRRSALQQLYDIETQSMTDPFMLPLLPTDALSPTTHQQPSILSQIQSNQGQAWAPSLSEMDPRTLRLLLATQNGIGRNQAHDSQLGTSTTSQFLSLLHQPQRLTSYASIPHLPDSSTALDFLMHENGLRGPLPDEQTIRDAILLVHQQLSSATDNV
jgi:HSF-type DNA-binding